MTPVKIFLYNFESIIPVKFGDNPPNGSEVL